MKTEDYANVNKNNILGRFTHCRKKAIICKDCDRRTYEQPDEHKVWFLKKGIGSLVTSLRPL